MRARRIASVLALAGLLLAGTACAGATNATAIPSTIPPDHPWRVSMTVSNAAGSESAAEKRDQVIVTLDTRLDRLGVTDATLVRGTGPDAIVGGFVEEPSDEVLAALETPLGLEFRPVWARDASTAAMPRLDPADAAPDVAAELEGAWAALDCQATPPPVAHGPVDEPIVACSADGTTKFVLAPTEISAADVASAVPGELTNSAGDAIPGQFAVTIALTGSGTDAFLELTRRLASLEPPANALAIVVDGVVMSAPAVASVIANGTMRISGDFTKDEAASLADDIVQAASPLTVRVVSIQRVDDASS